MRMRSGAALIRPRPAAARASGSRASSQRVSQKFALAASSVAVRGEARRDRAAMARRRRERHLGEVQRFDRRRVGLALAPPRATASGPPASATSSGVHARRRHGVELGRRAAVEPALIRLPDRARRPRDLAVALADLELGRQRDRAASPSTRRRPRSSPRRPRRGRTARRPSCARARRGSRPRPTTGSKWPTSSISASSAIRRSSVST